MSLSLKNNSISRCYAKVACLPSIFLLLWAFTSVTAASPWVEPNDIRLRHSLEYLNDTGVINLSLSTWPVMWGDVKYALSHAESSRLSFAQRQAMAYVKFELGYQTRSNDFRNELRIGGASEAFLFREFGDVQREKGEFSLTSDWVGERFAFGGTLTLAIDPQDDKSARVDHSYISVVLGNWVLGAGEIERWWGPGWQSSLIMSNNARPMPTLFFRRNIALPPDSEWFKWIGPWQFETFVGQLEGNRHIPRAKTLGMRLTVKPFNWIELGASRLTQWGGEGRSQNLSALWDSFTGQDENTPDGAGNQIGGFDFRALVFSARGLNAAIYGQAIGEDESGFLPSKYSALAGITASGTFDQTPSSWRIYIETEDTIAGHVFGDSRYNIVYEHSTYQSGMRYYGRSLGSDLDNDSERITLGGMLAMENGDVWRVSIASLQLNQDGVQRGNRVSLAAQEVVQVSGDYEFYALGGRLSLGARFFSEEVTNKLVGSARYDLSASWLYRF